jgi:hypothetical protein
MFLRKLNDFMMFVLHVERHFDPFFRPVFDAIFRAPSTAMVQFLVNLQRKDEHLAIAEERVLPEEERYLQETIGTMKEYMRQQYQPGSYQRAGNTKTHAIIRAEMTINDDLPPNFRRGIFAEPKTYRAWVRVAGPGPNSPTDIDDLGVLSFAVKLMGVPGPKLLDDEKFTQDFLALTTPTFTTPNMRALTVLQGWILKGAQSIYFVDPRDSHILDLLMQALWSRTQSNPLGERYWSCAPYLLGEGQAMMYSLYPRTKVNRRIPRLPFRPPDNYLRENMIKTLAEKDVEFDLMLQLQTDSFRMPIENASVRWPERLSPFVPAARLRIPRQQFASPAQLAFANNLSFNPWHCLPEHRPLGNQNRARHQLYWELSQFRQKMNATPHIEPTGDEVFA